MDIVVRGRHAELSDRFREHVAHKLSKVERYDGKCQRVDVEVSAEANPRLADQAVRVEITCRGKGPTVRGEAAAPEKYAALDVAFSRLEERLRRASERRIDRARKVKGAPRTEPGTLVESPSAPSAGDDLREADGEGQMVVREKTHEAAPMSLDQALYAMELVGHDFYLFCDEATGQPSVVYRRKGYDYGVIRLSVMGGQ